MKSSETDLTIKRLEEIKAKSNSIGAKNTQKVIDYIKKNKKKKGSK